jgi:RimJ/RimL family protein N-acetyltransferase
MKYFKKMIGKRCYLSPMNTENAEKYVAWLNDMEVAQYLTVAYHNINLDVERETLERFARQGDHFAIVDRSNDELIGGCGFLNLENIMLNVYAFNTRAIRCYRNIGFKEMDRRRRARRIQGTSYDIIYMDLLAEEFSGGSSLPPLPLEE